MEGGGGTKGEQRKGEREDWWVYYSSVSIDFTLGTL